MSSVEMACRGCGLTGLVSVLELSPVAPADLFPPADSAAHADESAYRLEMASCSGCGLAQLVTDDTTVEEPLGVEPQALKDQANEALSQLFTGKVLVKGMRVAEFTSPHGGSWTPIAVQRGLVAVGDADDHPADVVFDSFGMMHAPDQRAAVAARARATATDGVLLLQFHSLATIAAQHQWMSLRHGHYAYYSLSTLVSLLSEVGMSVTDAWEFDLYGGTVLIAARHANLPASAAVSRILAAERAAGIDSPSGLAGLQQSVDDMLGRVRRHADAVNDAGGRCFAYGAASRAVATFTLADLSRDRVHAVADSSPGKQGRRMPGTDIPIVSPGDLAAMLESGSAADSVWLTLPDLRAEVAATHPALAPYLVVLD